MSEQQPTFCVRLFQLRRAKGLTQKSFANVITEIAGRGKAFAVSTISSWELGTKCPSFDTLSIIADYFEVTTDYLLGRSDSAYSNGENKMIQDDQLVEVSINDLTNYDGRPVFIVFDDKSVGNRWGIYNAKNKVSVCLDMEVKLKQQNVKYYMAPSMISASPKLKRERLNLETLKTLSRFWVDYISPDPEIKDSYSGWYKHDRFGNIINDSGIVLPIAGLNKTYYAYKKNDN